MCSSFMSGDDMLGSTSDSIVRKARCSTIVVKPDRMRHEKRYEGSAAVNRQEHIADNTYFGHGGQQGAGSLHLQVSAR